MCLQYFERKKGRNEGRLCFSIPSITWSVETVLSFELLHHFLHTIITSSMDEDTDVHVRWDHHQTTLLSVFGSLLNNENLVDCTISAEGQHFKAHRVILSACSPYFESLFSQHCEMHPVVILPDVKFQILKALMEFMYCGEVKVPQDKLRTVFELADTLQIKGLSPDIDNEMKDNFTPKRSNESSIFHDQHNFKKNLNEHRSGSQVKQKEVPSLYTSEKEHSGDIDCYLLAAQKCVKSDYNSVSDKRTFEEATVFQDINDTDAFNMLQCSSVTKPQVKSNTHLSGTLLTSDSNVLDASQMSGSYIVKFGEHRILSANVVSAQLSSEELRTSESLGVSGEGPAADLLPQMKQQNPDDSNSNSKEVIILDDEINERYSHDHGSDGNNRNAFGGFTGTIPEQSFSGQSVCDLEQYRDIYITKPETVLSNPYNCNACGRSYQYSKGLNRHLRYECGKTPKFKCPRCPWRFFHKHQLNRHIIRAHSSY